MPAFPPAALETLTARSDVWRGASGARPRTEPSGWPALDARLPGGGWPAGALSELFLEAPGIGELRLALPLLARLTQAGRHVVFVAPPHLPYAPALATAGLVLPRVLVAEPGNADEILWAAEQLLRSPAYGAVLAWTASLRDADSRKLQLAAESSGAVALLYRPLRAAGRSGVAALRLALKSREGRLEIEILKSRGGRTGTRFFVDEDQAPAAGRRMHNEEAA